MPAGNHDRNMLFGILAQQMDFVSRDALIAAMHAWVQEKSKPLGQILVDQKALTPDTHALLEALVTKHLEMHGNNAEFSLAAISSVDSVKKDLAHIGDADVQASLVHVASKQPTKHDPHGAATVSVGEITSRGTRFRILRPHAKGGLGQVFVAEDSELHREVALKEIQGKHADAPESRARFVMEAEITGGLEHPGIVPVYGLGQYADGRPFYAMRFIKGDSLKEVLEKYHRTGSVHQDANERNLELRNLLGRLIDVCQAIQYAHDRGILHRDLKPGNIMLGKYGETLVVDWGLAKPIDKIEEGSTESVLRPIASSGTSQTIAGTAIGTPGYMSPEQASGKLADIGPASDVYSLGATLYAILTGQAPAEDSAVELQRNADLGKVLKKVQTGAIAKPRQVKPDVDPALEAICLKAMSVRATDRYAAPRDLAGDLERWLADEPVSAMPESWTTRTRRWIGKHRTLVTGVAAAVLVGLVTLSVATVLLAQANDLIQNKNSELTTANSTIKKQNDEIKLEVAEKEKQRKLAESRLAQSLDAVGLFANDARQYCEDAVVPNASRQRLFEVLTKQLERQVDQEPGEATIDSLRNKAWMYQTLCTVTSDFGDTFRSTPWFQKGIKTVNDWDKLKPNDPQALAFRAAFLHLNGVNLERQQQPMNAKPFFTEALIIRRRLANNADPGSAGQAKAFAMLADSLESVGQYDEALRLRENVALRNDNDRDAFFAARQAWCWTYLKAALDANDYVTRKPLLQHADKMSKELIRERPTSRNVLLRWAMTARALGELEYNTGKLAEKDIKLGDPKKYFAAAEIHYKKLNEISRKLVTADEFVDGIRDYARSYYTLGLIEDLNGNTRQARDDFKISRDIRVQTGRDYGSSSIAGHLAIDLMFSQLAVDDPELTVKKASDLALAYREEPVAQYRLACVFALAINSIAEARKPEPLSASDKRMQMLCHQEAIRCLQLAHDGGFNDFFQTSVDADFDAIRHDPAMKEFEASHQYQLGTLAKKRGDDKRAEEHFEKCQQLAKEWIKARPKDSRRNHVKLLWLAAEVQMGQRPETFDDTDAIWRELSRTDVAVFRIARIYALASASVVNLKLQMEYRDKAFKALEQAVNANLNQAVLVENDLEPLRSDPRFQEIVRLYDKKRR